MTLLACSQEIESDPNRDAGEGIRLSLASTASAAAAAEDRYPTYLYSERDVDVYSRFGSGDYFEQGVIVENIHVEVGDAVQGGQILATLDDSDVVIDLEAAQAAADEADGNFARIELMREREVVPQAEYDQALYAKRTAEAQLKRAQLDHSRTRVRAPFAGVVSRRYIRAAELIEASTPLFRITAMTPLRARILVPETRAAEFRAGAAATVIGADGETGTARVIVVSPTVDPGSGTREVIVELLEPDGFRPGAAVTVTPTPDAELEDR
jgi:membrane fusion protein (multidrug efflux system)